MYIANDPCHYEDMRMTAPNTISMVISISIYHK